jgi:cell division protein FtsA
MAEILLGLDIGSTKVAAVVGRQPGGWPEAAAVRLRPGQARRGSGGPEAEGRGAPALLAAAVTPCQGLRRGVVVDVAEVARAIRESVLKARQSARVETEAAWVGITGEHMTCLNSHAEIRLTRAGLVQGPGRANREITWADVERVMAAAVGAASIPPDRQTIHAVSRGFTVDEEPRVRNPVGLTASRLAVDTHVVTVPRNLVENIVKCVEQAGLSVAELVAEPLATADAVLTAEEEELGVLLADMGGGTTDLALFVEGSIAFTGVVPVAGDYLTHDIAVAVGVPRPEAERVKLAYGGVRASVTSEEEDNVAVADEAGARMTSRRFLAEVIRARADEIFRLVRQRLAGMAASWPPAGGVVLTGGSSLLPGIAPLAEEVLACRVRLGRPRVGSGSVEPLASPTLATGVGLVYYAHREAEARRARPGGPKGLVMVLPVLGRVVAWVKERFRS